MTHPSRCGTRKAPLRCSTGCGTAPSTTWPPGRRLGSWAEGGKSSRRAAIASIPRARPPCVARGPPLRITVHKRAVDTEYPTFPRSDKVCDRFRRARPSSLHLCPLGPRWLRLPIASGPTGSLPWACLSTGRSKPKGKTGSDPKRSTRPSGLSRLVPQARGAVNKQSQTCALQGRLELGECSLTHLRSEMSIPSISHASKIHRYTELEHLLQSRSEIQRPHDQGDMQRDMECYSSLRPVRDAACMVIIDIVVDARV